MSRDKYSPERKNAILCKLLPPNSEPIPQVAREEGIPEDTLYTWKRKALNKDANPALLASLKMSSAERAMVFADVARMSDIELGAYAREHGLYVAQLKAIISFYLNVGRPDDGRRAEKKAENAEISDLKKENKRLEAALAETAALLVLSKKARAIWGDRKV